MGSLDKKKNYKKIAKEVIDLEIKALKKLKVQSTRSFNEAVDANYKMSIKSDILWCWKKWFNSS